MVRHEYRLVRDDFRRSGCELPAGYETRKAMAADRLELADLMMDAYVDTIDYEGETPDQAVEEVDGYLESEAYLDVSLVAISGGVIQSAVLMSRIVGIPLVGYVMTRAAVKSRGIASALLDIATEAVWATGADEIRAFITEGNLPSEAIFTNAGYKRISAYDD